MARYKHYDYQQTKMIPLRFADQLQLGTFEFTLNHVVDNDLDLSVFESRYRNDYNGFAEYLKKYLWIPLILILITVGLFMASLLCDPFWSQRRDELLAVFVIILGACMVIRIVRKSIQGALP